MALVKTDDSEVLRTVVHWQKHYAGCPRIRLQVVLRTPGWERVVASTITTEMSRTGSLGKASDLLAPSGFYRDKTGIPESMVLTLRALAVGAVVLRSAGGWMEAQEGDNMA